jgi:maleate cis-trans isomerase
MYGWRGRIGLIVPSSNTTCEMEFHKMVLRGCLCTKLERDFGETTLL